MSAAVARTCPVMAGKADFGPDVLDVSVLAVEVVVAAAAVVAGEVVVAAAATLIQALEIQWPSVSWA
jgi:hypothetical protein